MAINLIWFDLIWIMIIAIFLYIAYVHVYIEIYHSSEWHFYPSGTSRHWFFLPLTVTVIFTVTVDLPNCGAILTLWFPLILWRTHWRNCLKFGMLMYPGRLQKWLYFSHSLLIFLICVMSAAWLCTWLDWLLAAKGCHSHKISTSTCWNSSYKLLSWSLPVKLVLGEGHTTPRIFWHWIMEWLGAIRQWIITWANVDPGLSEPY